MTPLCHLTVLSCVLGASLSRTSRTWAPGYMISGEGRLIHEEPQYWQYYDEDDMLAQGDVSRPFVDFSSDNRLYNSYTTDPQKDIDREPKYVPSLVEVIRRKEKKTSYPANSDYYEFYSDEESEKINFDAVPTRRLSLSESVAGSFIQHKLSQLGAVLRRADDTLDAVFTLLVPGHDERMRRRHDRNKQRRQDDDYGDSAEDSSLFPLLVSSLVVAFILSL